MKLAIGLDIGGTKIAAGIITETGELLHRAEVKSDTSDRGKMFESTAEAVEQVLETSFISTEEIAGIGVGVPGKVDRRNGIAIYQNNLPWEHFPVASRLRERFGIEQIIVDNDVCMAAFAEWKDSQAKRPETFVYMTVSTGIACAIIHQGSFLRGAGFAGEIGLIPVLADAKMERLEMAAAGPGIQRLAAKELVYEGISTKDVFLGYANGSRDHQKIIEVAAHQIAQGIYSVSCLLDPHRMVFGGSVIVNNPFLLELIKGKLKDHQLPEQQHLLDHMTISSMKQDNGIIGAGLRILDR